MAKLSSEEQVKKTGLARQKIAVAEAQLGNRKLLYELRRGFFEGTIKPEIERGHDYISTELTRTIAQRMASYFMGNLFSIKLKSQDVSDEESVALATIGNAIVDELYNNNAEFMEMMLEFAESSSVMGDAFITGGWEDGNPVHKLIANPAGVGIQFKDDQFKEYASWCYSQGVDVDTIDTIFGVRVSANPTYLATYGSGTVNTQNNPYGISSSRMLEGGYLKGDARNNMAKYTVVHDILEGTRTQLFNDYAYFADTNNEILYHFKANAEPGRPYGTCDFESAAQLVMKMEEKLSEESDVVSQGSHQKILTDQNPADIQRMWKPNRTQAFQIRKRSDGSGYMEILKTNDNVVGNEQFLRTLLNLIRTNSGLQELGQDQIAANVSGRAIQYMFQGVQLIVKSKQIRLNAMLNRMVRDDFTMIADHDAEIKKAFFDKDGKFKLRIDVKYPPVLEQEEQIRISNIQLMRQGVVPLMSDQTARALLSDYIDDPTEEAKRVVQEAEVKNKLQAEMIQSQQAAANPQPTAPATAQGGAPAMAPEGMEPANSTDATGTPSTPTAPGTAGQMVSPEGAAAQLEQNSTGANQ